LAQTAALTSRPGMEAGAQDGEEGNFICSACGGLVPAARRWAHEEKWCPKRVGNQGVAEISDDSADDEEDSPIPAEVKALISAQWEASIHAELSFSPSNPLRVAQLPNIDIACPEPAAVAAAHASYKRHEDHATGGQLWWSELVLAEYLALRHCSTQRGRIAVALGCGTGPVSAFTAAALGFDVLCTDLKEVVPLTQQTALANTDALSAARKALGLGTEPVGKLDFLPLPFGENLSEEVSSWLCNAREAASPGEPEQSQLLVLCSDCIWQAHRHRALAVTLAELLRAPKSEALIAYQLRQGAELRFFEVVTHYNLKSARLNDVIEAVELVRFPPQLLASSLDPRGNFFVHRVWRES